MWENALVEIYDRLIKDGEPICPIAHIYLTAHIGVLLDKDGNYLCGMKSKAFGELVPVPCTIESESRTGISPHLISDNLGYVGQIKGCEKKHKRYLEQLKEYTTKNKCDDYAGAVYKYISRNNVLDDIKDIIGTPEFPIERYNVIFGVYGFDNESIDLEWTKYYLSILPKNGICSVTGQPDYIPPKYPKDILSKGDNSKLYLPNINTFGIGYTASQKIVHMLQYFIYGQENSQRVEAEYKLKGFLDGIITKDELVKWIDDKYPGKSKKVIEILNGKNAD